MMSNNLLYLISSFQHRQFNIGYRLKYIRFMGARYFET